MLTPFDDYPIHQTPEPIAHTVGGDRNHYDRYFFNGYDRDGGCFFAAALGVYPNRQVIDAAFSVVLDGVQHAVFASGRAPLDRGVTRVGPLAVEVVEPLRMLRVTADAASLGIEADVTFTARTPAIEEPRARALDGPILRSDYTRLTQWGAWRGTVRAGGTAFAIEPDRVLGSRDRSWGVRGVGEPPGGAPARTPRQFFWLWAPLNFDDCCTHLALTDDAQGRHLYQSACVVPLLGEGAPAFGQPEAVEHMRDVDATVEWEPGTRRARHATLTLIPWRGEREVIELAPLLTFQMMGIGYLHPEWGHGRWHGEEATGSAAWTLAELDPLDTPHLHIQQVVRARRGGQDGIGVLEQLAIGPHAPSGFSGLRDGAPA
ncbi:MAG TPA: hypothetical protein VKV26_03910 [Dehalococcoidia bacterium]|nr:hypothetical protein [Dehalococcoidia bacterium]